MNKSAVYPIFLSLEEKSCVIVGGGSVAIRKASDLIEAGAKVTVVAENPASEIIELSEKGSIDLKIKLKTEDGGKKITIKFPE